MELQDEITITAPRDEVYAALNDPEVLKSCIPGCEELVQTSENELEAKVTLKVGPVKARFSGAVTLDTADAPAGFALSGQGNGGAAGFAKGGADVRIEASETGTLLSYDVEAKVGGKLAQLGSRLIDGFAKKMADQFFTNLQTALEGGGAESEAAPEEKKKGWLSRLRGG